jgi:WD40 repeat protein
LKTTERGHDLLDHTDFGHGMKFHPDGRLFSAGDLRVWDGRFIGRDKDLQKAQAAPAGLEPTTSPNAACSTIELRGNPDLAECGILKQLRGWDSNPQPTA